MMRLKPISKDAVDLFLNGTLTLSKIECNGIRIDTDYLAGVMQRVVAEIADLEKRMLHSKEWGVWQRMHGVKANLTSRLQLGEVLFGNVVKGKENISKQGNLGYECNEFTETGKPKVSEETLEDIDCPFVRDYVEYMSLQKVLTTSLGGIQDGLDSEGYLHPSFSLNTVQTYRSSSANPNFQNFPNRNKRLSELVRRCFIPRSPDRHFVEIDFSGSEVRCATAYHRDERMIQYLTDKSSDMHKDMAAQCYRLPRESVNKAIRNAAKGSFVFAAFYGSYWKGLAEGLWKTVKTQKTSLDDCTLVIDHLKSLGYDTIGELSDDNQPKEGTFYAHIKEVEDDFWGNRFAQYGQWKKDTWKQYLNDGYVDFLSGFRCSGIFSRNEILNAPIQGLSFHCLLWSLVQIQRGIEKFGWGTVLLGQIHDSIVADVPDNELDRFLEFANYVMTKGVNKHYPFLVVPMEVELEVASKGLSWFEKKPYKISA